jgi:ATP-dependent RNA helicase RhlE
MKSMQDVFRIFENDFFEAMRAGSFILNAMTTTFKMLNLTKPCLEAVADLGFSEPTPIQEQAIPFGLKNEDILAAAQTGTGKTLAYLLPIFDQMVSFWGSKRPKKNRGPYALILSPTRELAQQIAQCAQTIAKITNFRVATVIGGKKYSSQINKLKQGCDILIATPGRLIDLLDQHALTLNAVHYLVLDEVDRMLDMGFWPPVYSIVKKTPVKRQTFFFSATLTPVVLEKARLLQKNPQRIEISHCGDTADTVEEYVMPVMTAQKQSLLVALLEEKKPSRAIVFTHTKQEADTCAHLLQKTGFKADSIHSDKTQAKRDRALKYFKNGNLEVLVATDVLARGIDVSDVEMVVNLSVPDNPEDYVHRIGRTGRAGVLGEAYTMLAPEQLLELREIEYFTESLLSTFDLEGFEYASGRLIPDPKRPTKKGMRPKGRGGRRLSFRRR